MVIFINCREFFAYFFELYILTGTAILRSRKSPKQINENNGHSETNSLVSRCKKRETNTNTLNKPNVQTKTKSESYVSPYPHAPPQKGCFAISLPSLYPLCSLQSYPPYLLVSSGSQSCWFVPPFCGIFFAHPTPVFPYARVYARIRSHDRQPELPSSPSN